MQNLRRCAPVLVALLAFGPGCGDDDDDIEATITVVNDSDYVIHEIYLTETDDDDWGPNLLGIDPLLPDQELYVGVECDYYDALLIDEEGVECELYGLDLCGNDATWFIYNDTCVAFARKAQAQAAAEAVKAPPGGAAAP